MRRTIVVEVENRPGELARIVNLFAARNLNIEALTVGDASMANVSRITVITATDADTAKRVVRIIDKQIRVLSAREIPTEETTNMNGPRL